MAPLCAAEGSRSEKTALCLLKKKELFSNITCSITRAGAHMYLLSLHCFPTRPAPLRVSGSQKYCGGWFGVAMPWGVGGCGEAEE